MVEQENELIVCLCKSVDWLKTKVAALAKHGRSQEAAVMELKLELTDADKYGMGKTRRLVRKKLALINTQMLEQKTNYEKSLAETKQNYVLLNKEFDKCGTSHDIDKNKDNISKGTESTDLEIIEELLAAYKLEMESFERLYMRHCLVLNYGFACANSGSKSVPRHKKQVRAGMSMAVNA